MLALEWVKKERSRSKGKTPASPNEEHAIVPYKKRSRALSKGGAITPYREHAQERAITPHVSSRSLSKEKALLRRLKAERALARRTPTPSEEGHRARSPKTPPPRKKTPKKRATKEEKAFALPKASVKVAKRQVVIEALTVQAKVGQVLLVNPSLLTSRPVAFEVSSLESWGTWFARVAFCKTLVSLKVFKALANSELHFKHENTKLEQHVLQPGQRYELKKKEVFLCAAGDVKLGCESKKDAGYFTLGNWYGLAISVPQDSKGRGLVFTAVN
jgi:hypothetical protein